MRQFSVNGVQFNQVALLKHWPALTFVKTMEIGQKVTHDGYVVIRIG